MDTTTTSSDIEAELIELYSLVEEKDKEIAKLKQDVLEAAEKAEANARTNSSRSSNKDRKCRAQLSECKDNVVDLEARLKQSQLDQQTLVDQKDELEQRVATLTTKISGQTDNLQQTSKLSKEQSDDQRPHVGLACGALCRFDSSGEIVVQEKRSKKKKPVQI